jgi:enoyl-CoA hydratase/carnithine racemase
VTTEAEVVLLERPEDGVALVRINRPAVRNALNLATREALAAAFEGLQDDPDVRAIVLTGDERAFAAGADLREFIDAGAVEIMRRRAERYWQSIARTPQPVIAAINGYALGGGLELAMCCDILIAGESAQLGQPEVRVGIMPGAGGTQRLTRAVGKAKAMELCLTGRMMKAEEAERANLVSRIVPADELLEEAMKIADKIANLSQHAVMMIKEAINRGFATTLAEGTRFERGQFYSLFATEDQKEGMAAFIDKRKPDFKNR